MNRWVVTITKNSGCASGFLAWAPERQGGWSFSRTDATVFDEKAEAEKSAERARAWFDEADIENLIIVRGVRIQGINEPEEGAK